MKLKVKCKRTKIKQLRKVEQLKYFSSRTNQLCSLARFFFSFPNLSLFKSKTTSPTVHSENLPNQECVYTNIRIYLNSSNFRTKPDDSDPSYLFCLIDKFGVLFSYQIDQLKLNTTNFIINFFWFLFGLATAVGVKPLPSKDRWRIEHKSEQNTLPKTDQN